MIVHEKRVLKILQWGLSLFILLSLALAGCGGNKTSPESQSGSPVYSTSGETIVLGEGEQSFLLDVVDIEGEVVSFEIHTDAETVGEALLDLELIQGDEGPYGLYVKTVNGETVDYDEDGKYWAFYEDGDYALAGVDLTEIEEGSTYTLKVE